jgi:hypothetical protein
MAASARTFSSRSEAQPLPVPKVPLKLLGLLETYHLWWWSQQVRQRPVLTDWNRVHSAIFVHIPKTAGTTVLDLLRADPVFDTHAPASTYRDADPELFARAFKFAFVRNPWDRFASAFHFMKGGTDWPMQQQWAKRHVGNLDFAEFVRKLRNPLFRQVVLSERFFWPQTFWVTGRRGELLVDELYRFEDLQSALPEIAKRLGVAPPVTLPARRKSDRASSAALYTDPEMVELVGRLYAEDAERFGYGFAGDSRWTSVSGERPQGMNFSGSGGFSGGTLTAAAEEVRTPPTIGAGIRSPAPSYRARWENSSAPGWR